MLENISEVDRKLDQNTAQVSSTSKIILRRVTLQNGGFEQPFYPVIIATMKQGKR